MSEATASPKLLRVLIVDDERPARAELRRCLVRHADVEIIGEAADGLTALETILADRPDLVFLDVQMPELTGLEVLESLAPGDRPAVVFVTAYDTFALEAFEVQAVDYLLKPFDEHRFDTALERARSRVGRTRPALEGLLSRFASNERSPRRLAARCGGRMVLVEVSSIERAESARNYVLLGTDQGEQLLRSTLSSLEQTLPAGEFVRLHRRHLARTLAIRELRRDVGGDWNAHLRDGTVLPVGRRFRDSVVAALRESEERRGRDSNRGDTL